ncbi:MAG TPA: hypothetical protein VJ044_16585, partial [Candidatus Hodarchaeales archaeon]|nr:hypothetical protein [Candidatus Hodarchaeales archaeon]
MTYKDNINQYLKPQYALAVFFLFIYCLSTPANAQMLSEIHIDSREKISVQEGFDLEKDIFILFDSSDTRFVVAAKSILDSLKFVYFNIHLQPIEAGVQLETFFREKRPFAVIWMFDTNLQGLRIGENSLVPWEELASTIGQTPRVNHIMGLGNTEDLRTVLATNGLSGSNLFTQPTLSGVVDLKIGYFYSMWKLSELFLGLSSGPSLDSYHRVGETLRVLAAKFFEKEINDLVYRNIEPKDPIGEINTTDQQVRFEEMKKRFPEGITSRTKISRTSGGVVPPLVFRSNLDALSPGDFLLGLIPGASGLQGPIGFILDGLFSLLLGGDDGEIVLTEEAIELIMSGFQILMSLVGGEGLNSQAVSSALRSLLDILFDEFPFGEQLIPYMELVLDGLIALKGDVQSILNFITKLINTIIPDSVPQLFRDVITNIVNMTAGVIQEVQQGEEILTAILKTVTSNMFANFAMNLLNQTLGVSPAQFSRYRELILDVVNFMTSLFSKDVDVVQLLEDNFDSIIIGGLGLLTGGNAADIVQKISKAVSFGLSIVRQGVNGELRLLDRAKDLLTEFVPDSVSNKATQVANAANKLVELIGDIRKSGTPSITDIQNALNDIYGALDSAGLPAQASTFLRTVTKWVFGVLADKLPDSARSALPSLREVVDSVLDYVDDIFTGSSFGAEVGEISAISNSVKQQIKQIADYAVGIFAMLGDPTGKIKQLVNRTVSDFVNSFEKRPVQAVVGVLKLIFADNSSIITDHVSRLESWAELA